MKSYLILKIKMNIIKMLKTRNNEDKYIYKIEKYVDKKRDTISKNMTEKKEKRKNNIPEIENLDVMISKIEQSSSKNHRWRQKNTAKIILYLIYITIISSFIYITSKYILNNWPH